MNISWRIWRLRIEAEIDVGWSWQPRVRVTERSTFIPELWTTGIVNALKKTPLDQWDENMMQIARNLHYMIESSHILNIPRISRLEEQRPRDQDQP